MNKTITETGTPEYYAVPVVLRPTVGQPYRVRQELGTIIVVRPAGTIDVEMADGRCYRVTGLAFRDEATR